MTIEIVEVIEHHGMTVVRGGDDGTYDKTYLPAVLVLTNYSSCATGRSFGWSCAAISELRRRGGRKRGTRIGLVGS